MTDIEDLIATSDQYFKAWPERDVETIVGIEDGLGYGHSVAFAREPGTTEQRKAALSEFFEMFDVYDVTPIDRRFSVSGTTGLEWGHYSQTSKQKNGPLRTVYLRFTNTFVKLNGNWKLALYHRSKIPSENIP